MFSTSVEDKLSKMADLLSACRILIAGHDTPDVQRRLDLMEKLVKVGVQDSTTLLALVDQYPEHKPVPIDTQINKEYAVQELYKMTVGAPYAMRVLEACTLSERSYDTAYAAVLHASSNKASDRLFDMVPYIADKSWSEEWIKALVKAGDYVFELRAQDVDVLQYITPNHSPNGFITLCLEVFRHSVPKFGLEWYRDPYWRNMQIKTLFELHLLHPDVNYLEFVNSLTPLPAMLDIIDNNVMSLDEYDAILRQKWEHMTPKLEYAIYTTEEPNNVARWISFYRKYRNMYQTDGDSLAGRMSKDYSIEYPEEIISYNEYYNSKVIPTGAVDWIRKNGPKALDKLTDEEAWEVWRENYYSSH